MYEARSKTAMAIALRTFGVSDPDTYWRRRQAKNDVDEGRLHRYVASLVDGYFPPGATVLDCGLGDGHAFRLCGRRHQSYAIDYSEEAIRLSGAPRDRVRQADLNQGIPAFGDGGPKSFDVIIASMILHWLAEPDLFLDRARAALNPGGKLIIVIPNITYYRHRLAFLRGTFPPISLSHKNFQTPAEVEAMLAERRCDVARRTTPKTSLHARLWPTVFGQDMVYVIEKEPLQ
jgi:SAM-dependent methyltransferase